MSDEKVIYRFVRVAHRNKSGWCSCPAVKEKRLKFVNGMCQYVASKEEAVALDEFIEKCERPYGNQYVLDELREPRFKVAPTFGKISTDTAFRKPEAPSPLGSEWVPFHEAVKFNAGKYEKGLGPIGLNSAVREGRVHRAEREDGTFYYVADIAKELDLKKGSKE